ncbi:unnamed protein product, partial [Rotaria magnacalcarata]
MSSSNNWHKRSWPSNSSN